MSGRTFFKCQQQFGMAFGSAWLCSVITVIQGTSSIFQYNSKLDQIRTRVNHISQQSKESAIVSFSHKSVLWVLIGSLWYFPLLWLAVVITLVLAFPCYPMSPLCMTDTFVLLYMMGYLTDKTLNCIMGYMAV